jgi:hypothetical protein
MQQFSSEPIPAHSSEMGQPQSHSIPISGIPQEMGRGGPFWPITSHYIRMALNGPSMCTHECPRVPTRLFQTAVPTVRWKVRHAAPMAANSAPHTPFSSHPRHSTQVLMSAPSEGGCATPAPNGWAPFRPAPAPSSRQTFNDISLFD